MILNIEFDVKRADLLGTPYKIITDTYIADNGDGYFVHIGMYELETNWEMFEKLKEACDYGLLELHNKCVQFERENGVKPKHINQIIQRELSFLKQTFISNHIFYEHVYGNSNVYTTFTYILYLFDISLRDMIVNKLDEKYFHFDGQNFTQIRELITYLSQHIEEKEKENGSK